MIIGILSQSTQAAYVFAPLVKWRHHNAHANNTMLVDTAELPATPRAVCN